MNGTTVPWQDFLNMMADNGFVIESNGISAFAFIMDGYGRNVVHRLHPDSTLQTYHLRKIGMHWESQLGWQRKNFVQA